jgi:radical SAM superfamily enzyme YgiQ (UPF0313 family)
MDQRQMRIALISPKGPLYRHRGGIFRKSLRYMPLTLPTLAALIPTELDAEVVCIDEGIGDVDLNLDADLIGITVITGTALRAYELSRHFRSKGKTVVLGGPHVTLVPDDAQPHADSIVIGYAEDEWPKLLRDFSVGQLQRRYVQAPNLDLANRPLPNRSVLPEKRFLTANVFEATRGCVHDCSFCVVPSAWGRKPLHKPIDDIVADIRQRRAKQAIFVDLNIIADRIYARQLFEALTPLRIQWYGLATTLLCEDEPLLDLAARSGCRGLLMGLESIRSANLQQSHKRFNHPNSYGRIVQMLHERKIALQGCFVFGLDHDTADVFQETAELAVEIGIDLPRFAILTPFPGTPLYDQMVQQDRLLTRNWELYDGQHVVFQPSHMSPETLRRGNEQAWRYAYRWRSIVRRLRHTGAPLHVAITTNLGYRYYAHRLHRFYTCDWMTGFNPLHRELPTSPPAEMSATGSNG